MLALEHLHANALLVVLLGGALAIVSLRVAVSLLHRSLVATDRKVMSLISSRAPFDHRSHAEAPGASAARQQTSEHFTPDAHEGQLTETNHDTAQGPDSKT